ncbi:hypothetical protein NLG97_g5346 [Lecanicillium saksenae]|uniref:Uncharacterized protein n=1 Tax=Lecanicillium saksenae TaxID=468837 RepID=A0ACC1QU14_9HYPO|nr:hypothetical protein NLG97_g5346 [Lecanicillium saksenae]
MKIQARYAAFIALRTPISATWRERASAVEHHDVKAGPSPDSLEDAYHSPYNVACWTKPMPEHEYGYLGNGWFAAPIGALDSITDSESDDCFKRFAITYYGREKRTSRFMAVDKLSNSDWGVELHKDTLQWIANGEVKPGEPFNVSLTRTGLSAEPLKVSNGCLAPTGGNLLAQVWQYGNARQDVTRKEAKWQTSLLCLARGKAASCIYHPAPMTRPRETAPAPGISTEESVPVGQPFPALPVLQPITTASSPSSTATPDMVHATGTEFFGATAFCAIIDENRDIVSQDIGSYRNQQMHGSNWNASQVSESRVLAAIDVLLLLTNFPAAAECIHQYLDLSFTSMVPAHLIKACVASIQELIIEPCIGQSEEERNAHLRKVVLKLFENTSRPLELFTSVPASAYHTSFTGSNIRWEVVGFVLCVLGVSLKYDINKRHITSTNFGNMNDSHLMQQAAEAVEFCTSVCHRYNCVNHQALWLVHGGACLQSLVHGDMSFHYWRGIGDMSSMFFALGLHQDSAKLVGTCPFYQLELRRRYAAQIFSMDKTVSTLLGRPPRISGVHCASTLPADIDDEVLLLEGEDLDMALENIDINGWNIDRKYRGSTWRRLKLIVSRFREEVLGFIYVIQETHKMARKFTRASAQRIPVSAEYSIASSGAVGPRSHSTTGFVLILYYGLPGASILAVDLWKDLHGAPGDSAVQTSSIPRAEVLQNLSVFISTLQRIINRKEAHSPACKWVHGSLSRILSEILDPQLRKSDRTECSSAADALYLSTIGQDADMINFDSLFGQMETADWSASVSNVLL